MAPRKGNELGSWEVDPTSPQPKGETRARRSYCVKELVTRELDFYLDLFFAGLRLWMVDMWVLEDWSDGWDVEGGRASREGSVGGGEESFELARLVILLLKLGDCSSSFPGLYYSCAYRELSI